MHVPTFFSIATCSLGQMTFSTSVGCDVAQTGSGTLGRHAGVTQCIGLVFGEVLSTTTPLTEGQSKEGGL